MTSAERPGDQGRVLAFVDSGTEVDSVGDDADVVVLEPWWTPGPDTPSRVRPVRPAVQAVLDRVDLSAESLARLDGWAAEAGLPDRFLLDDVSWWDRLRMMARWNLHEQMLWRLALETLAPSGGYDTAIVPAGRPALAAVCRALGFRVELIPEPPKPKPKPAARAQRARPPAPSPLGRIRRKLRRLVRRLRRVPTERERRTATIDRRLRRLGESGGVLAIAWAGAFQVVETGRRRRFVDPYLALVLDRLAGEETAVTTVVMGPDHRRSAAWPSIDADPNMLPASIVKERWRRPEDGDIDSSGLAAELAAGPCPPLEVAGCDLGPAMREVVLTYAGPWLDDRRRWMRWSARFLEELRPRVLLVDREATRIPWIAAAQRAGIPVVSVQHGMIYPGTPEYCRPSSPGTVRPDRTCVFGPYERDILVRDGGYPPDEVCVTGSPRFDPDEAAVRHAVADRAEVRRELGVASGDRLLVVSVGHNAVGELHATSWVARLLGGPLPGAHVVVKLHPQDRSGGGYERLLAGIALAGGYPAPPISVVRDIDLYRLLAAADAHLGQESTVLTDAVVAGRPNMISVVAGRGDLLGYIAARVAVPVRSIEDVRAFMADPVPASPADRAAFLAAHFVGGDAAGRVASVIRSAMASGREGTGQQ